jgi:protein involved in polysaccharide export with SLBB domain
MKQIGNRQKMVVKPRETVEKYLLKAGRFKPEYSKEIRIRQKKRRRRYTDAVAQLPQRGAIPQRKRKP